MKRSSFRLVLKGSSTVRDVLQLVPLLKKFNFFLFLGLGLYSGIFAIYLQCPSKRSGTALIPVCLLYVLSTADFVSDLVALIFYVSNNSICKNTFLYISCADASWGITSTSNQLTANVISHNDCANHIKRLL